MECVWGGALHTGYATPSIYLEQKLHLTYSPKKAKNKSSPRAFSHWKVPSFQFKMYLTDLQTPDIAPLRTLVFTFVAE